MSLPTASYDGTAWRELAACRGHDPELFFPLGPAGRSLHDAERAMAICAHCPVQRACLDFALDTSQEYGIWGGLTEAERRTVRYQRRSATT
jgi:WhiB family transcriptional regulator, redox-sensing transcriptional regulator